MTEGRATTLDFVVENLPRAPARILEVGCGDGALARALDRRRYPITAIDPRAPRGRIFRRVGIEEFDDLRPFAAIIAVRSLHHIEDLAVALDRIRALLKPGGVFVVEEFAPERLLDPTTGRWYYYQRQAAYAAGLHRDFRVPATYASWRREWARFLRHMHRSNVVRRALGRRFQQRTFAWTPYLAQFNLDASLEPAEEELIRRRVIQPTGLRWVGVPRPIRRR